MTQFCGSRRRFARIRAAGFPKARYGLIHDAVLAQCDMLDGVKDGLLEDPRRCTFDPRRFSVRVPTPGVPDGAPGTALRTSTAGEKFTHARRDLPGALRGQRARLGGLAAAVRDRGDALQVPVFRDPNWDFRTLNFDRDVVKADEIDAAVGHFVATNPDLSAFKKRGGKLLQYHGWNDQQIAAQNSVNYYETVVAHAGKGGVDDSIASLWCRA